MADSFVIDMRSILFLIAVIFTFCICSSAKAQSNLQMLPIGSWAPSIPIEVLRMNDSLILDQKSGVGYGYLEFLKDNVISQCQSQHHCVRTNKDSYAMMLDYRWFKRGTWKINKKNLELDLGASSVICRICSGTPARLALIVTSITQR